MNHSPNREQANFDQVLNDVSNAVQHLVAAGMKPMHVRWSGLQPVIVIEPPPYTAFLRFAMCLRRREGNVIRTTMTAPVRGCRVEWIAETAVEPKAVGNG